MSWEETQKKFDITQASSAASNALAFLPPPMSQPLLCYHFHLGLIFKCEHLKCLMPGQLS